MEVVAVELALAVEIQAVEVQAVEVWQWRSGPWRSRPLSSTELHGFWNSLFQFYKFSLWDHRSVSSAYIAVLITHITISSYLFDTSCVLLMSLAPSYT